MKKQRWTAERQQQFLEALAATGNVSRSRELVGMSATHLYRLRGNDPAFRQAWERAEEIAADRLEEEAWRRAVEGFDEPVVSAGKLVRDENGNPVMVRRFSDTLLLALLRARRPAKFSKGLPGVLAIGSAAAPFDVRAMLLEKLALLASQTEPEMPPLIEACSGEEPADETEAAGAQ